MVVGRDGVQADCALCDAHYRRNADAALGPAVRAFLDCHPMTSQIPHRPECPQGWTRVSA